MATSPSTAAVNVPVNLSGAASTLKTQAADPMPLQAGPAALGSTAPAPNPPGLNESVRPTIAFGHVAKPAGHEFRSHPRYGVDGTTNTPVEPGTERDPVGHQGAVYSGAAAVNHSSHRQLVGDGVRSEDE